MPLLTKALLLSSVFINHLIQPTFASAWDVDPFSSASDSGFTRAALLERRFVQTRCYYHYDEDTSLYSVGLQLRDWKWACTQDIVRAITQTCKAANMVIEYPEKIVTSYIDDVCYLTGFLVSRLQSDQPSDRQPGNNHEDLSCFNHGLRCLDPNRPRPKICVSPSVS